MLSDGNPQVVAPDLYAALTRLERNQVMNYFGRRLAEEGRGFPNRPDDEDPSSVARRAFVQGTFVVSFFVYSTPFLLVGAAALSLVNGGVDNVFTIGALAVCATVVAVAMGRWGLRVRTIRRHVCSDSQSR